MLWGFILYSCFEMGNTYGFAKDTPHLDAMSEKEDNLTSSPRESTYLLLSSHQKKRFFNFGVSPASFIMHLQKVELPKRKTWNKEEYARRAKERKEREEKEILNLDLDQIKNQPSHTDRS